MMSGIYETILASINKQEKLLAVLIDPDKTELEGLHDFMNRLNASIATHVFVGGSEVDLECTGVLVKKLKVLTELPIVLFPGDITQITEHADGLLFLNLVSGRNPDYLIHKHVKAAPILRNLDLEVIPTGYILIENGKETSVQRVTGTQPMKRSAVQEVVHTAMASEYLGQKLIYLEAGSGANLPIDPSMIAEVKNAIEIPLIVGGGIRTKKELLQAYNAGADLVVIGTAFEENESFFNELKSMV